METYTTVTEAVNGLRALGFTANFELLDNEFRALEDGRTFKAEELTIVGHYRFEGATDPDDESIVFAIESDDGVRGVLVDAYGVYANPALSTFLKSAKVRKGSLR
jgi:hypothetical protein